jgi:hypothetical protein
MECLNTYLSSFYLFIYLFFPYVGVVSLIYHIIYNITHTISYISDIIIQYLTYIFTYDYERWRDGLHHLQDNFCFHPYICLSKICLSLAIKSKHYKKFGLQQRLKVVADALQVAANVICN